MDPLIAAARALLSVGAADLRTTVAGLGTDGLNWSPAPETNSIAVLTAHACTSAMAHAESALTGRFDYGRYTAEERTPAFALTSATEAQVLAFLDRFDTFIARLGDAGPIADPGGAVVVGEGYPPRTRAWSLIHAVEHLREHVGHAQLTRQIYLDRGRS